MAHEQNLLILRRSISRLLETSLLVLAIALGVGASSAGIALVLAQHQHAASLLELPLYRELVASTRESLDNMDLAARQREAGTGVRLTTSDLAASEAIPAISASYIRSSWYLDMIGSPGFPGRDAPPSDDPRASFAQAATDPDILRPTLENIRGSRVSEGFFATRNLVVRYGSLFLPEDFSQRSANIILGYASAKALGASLTSPLEPEALIGKRVLTRQGILSIAGVLEPSNDLAIDNGVLAPYQTSVGPQDFPGFNQLSQSLGLVFAVVSVKDLELASSELNAWFSTKYGSGKVQIQSPRQELEQTLARNQGAANIVLFLSLAGLFMAGVNVSHILMSRGMRMQKNLGILMALGASRRSLLQLLATEAMLITLAGSLLGLVLAIPLNLSLQASLTIASTSPLSLVIGMLGALAVSLAFGILPAWQTTKIDPAQAMRHV